MSKGNSLPVAEKGDYLSNIKFSADDAMIYEEIPREAIKAFEKHILKYAWVLCVNGAIRNDRIDSIQSICYQLDFSDKTTRRNFSGLEDFFKGKMSESKRSTFSLRVLYYDGALNEQQEDDIVMRNGNLYIKSFADAWEKAQSNNSQLFEELEKLAQTIPDIKY